MWLYYFALIITVVSSALYHIVQKSTPANVNPIISVFTSYVVAMLLCIISYPFFYRDVSIISAFKELNWTSYALGLAIFGIEFGYLMAYRAGWDVSLASLISAVLVSFILIVFGMTVFQEKLTLINYLGVLLCIIGIVLIKIKL